MNYFKLLVFLITAFLISCSSDDPDTDDTITILPNIGLSNISFQDDGAKVIDIYGAYERVTVARAASDADFVLWYDSKGLGFRLQPVNTSGYSLQETIDNADQLIDLDQNIKQIILMSPFAGQTNQGIGIGSTRDEIEAAYGLHDSTFGSGELHENVNIYFSYNSMDIVTRMDISQ